MLDRRRRQAVLGEGGASLLVYLLRDKFTTPQSAPVISPRTCEPGPGTLTITDTGNKLNVSDGSLVASGVQSGFADPLIVGPDRKQVAGRLGYIKLTTGSVVFAYANSGGIVKCGGILVSGGNIYLYDANSYIGPLFAKDVQEIAIIQKDISAMVLVKSTGDADWTLVHVGMNDTANGAGFDMRHLYFTNNSAVSILDLQERDLGGVWSTSKLYSTVYCDDIVSSGYEASVENANMLVEIKCTQATGQTIDVMVRRTDDDNCWIVRANLTANTIKLLEKVGGIETERATSAQGAGNSPHISIRCSGNNIVFSDTEIRGSYASAITNNTATGIKVIYTGGNVSNLRAWPLACSTDFLNLPAGREPINIFLIGDSKTAGEGFSSPLAHAIETTTGAGCYCSRPALAATGGYTIEDIRSHLVSNLSTRNHVPNYILINAGANDLAAGTTETNYINSYLGVIDILQAKWPTAKIYCVKTWIGGKNAEADIMAGWINAIVAERSYTFVGHDERIWLKGTDDGATMTTDRVHYSAAGQIECASQWQVALGY